MSCQWIDSKLEALFTESLSREELKLCELHLASCEECRRQVKSLRDVDALVRGVFQRRIAVAGRAGQAYTRARVWKMALAGASLAAVAVVLVGIGLIFMPQTPAPPLAVQLPNAPKLEQGDKKDNGAEPSTERTKPDGTPAETAAEPQLDSADENGPEFAITNPAGYTDNLDSYRGHVLLFAVVSPGQKGAVANLQQIYNTFGSKPGIRILGVARHREDSFEGATFPIYYNHGSKLLGVADGGFLLLDKSGKQQLDGSLTDSRNLTRIRSQLAQLGIQ